MVLELSGSLVRRWSGCLPGWLVWLFAWSGCLPGLAVCLVGSDGLLIGWFEASLVICLPVYQVHWLVAWLVDCLLERVADELEGWLAS